MFTSLDHPEFNAVIASIGQDLAIERESRGQSTRDVADALLFSIRQVEGIESGCMKAFYNDRFYRQCADKYAMYLGLTPLPSEQIQEIECMNEQIANEVVAPDLSVSKTSPNIPKYLTLSALVVLILSLLALYWVFQGRAPNTIDKTPKVVQAENTNPPVPENPQAPTEHKRFDPLSQQQSHPASNDKHIIHLKFNDSCWVQSVSKDGQKTVKNYRAGETLDIAPQTLQALIIGNRNAVRMFAQTGTEISLKEFSNPDSNVVRIIGTNIRDLGQLNDSSK